MSEEPVEESLEARGQGWEAAACTHPGLRRSINQDTFICDPERGLLAVIDGMGGAAAGEVAAALTRDALLLGEDLTAALVRANADIQARAAANPAERGMGCVATAVRLGAERLRLAHVGDTRAYLASRAGCEQLTRDHTVVAEERERRGMTAEEARQLPGQHQVTRDVGGQLLEGADWIDTGAAVVEPGDVLLMCSDGLHDLVREGELSRLLVEARHPSTAMSALVDRLLRLALARGGHDNITIIAARRESDSLEQFEDEEPTDVEGFEIVREEVSPLPAPRPQLPPPRPLHEETITDPTVDAGVDLDEDEEELTESTPSRSGCFILLVSIVMSLALAGLGFLVGRSLDGGTRSLVIPAGGIVAVQSADLEMAGAGTWTLRIEPGAKVTLNHLNIQAVERTWLVSMGAGARLEIVDSTLRLARIQIEGAADAEVWLKGSSIELDDGSAEIATSGPIVREEQLEAP